MWQKLLLPAYAQLMGLVGEPTFAAVAIMLQSRKCLWVGRQHGFLSLSRGAPLLLAAASGGPARCPPAH